MTTKKQETAELRAESVKRLAELLPEGATLYAIIDSVARSGMSRTMRFYALKDSEPYWITRDVARVIDCPMVHGYRDNVRIPGCGMDMVFWATYEISQAIHPNAERRGYTLKHSTL